MSKREHQVSVPLDPALRAFVERQAAVGGQVTMVA
jgi:hypothetical protein